jgi:hypothetical protein
MGLRKRFNGCKVLGVGPIGGSKLLMGHMPAFGGHDGSQPLGGKRPLYGGNAGAGANIQGYLYTFLEMRRAHRPRPCEDMAFTTRNWDMACVGLH